MSQQQKIAEILDWVYTHLEQRQSINYKHSSYGIKHRAEYDLGFHVPEMVLVFAMLLAGYQAKQYGKATKHYFNVTQRSVNRCYKRQNKKGYKKKIQSAYE